ncbi:hypothetical protein ACFV46_09510 [Streptomyces sp. NPDC059852]|uniref:hypothetical protein n=1 Tax=Streptomyces TaxID=1883 RepID=UPI0035DF87E7
MATGWWPTVPAQAELLEDRGRAEEAVALPRAERLVDRGRVEEALRALRQPPPADPVVVPGAGGHPTEPPF